MNFLAWHGGPLVTLTNTDLTVTLAPLLNGQIRQFTFRGQPLLHIENNAKAKGFPFVGGSVDAVGTRHMLLDGEPTARTARVVGDAGVAMFGSATKQIVHRSFALDDRDTLVVTNTVRLPLPGATTETRGSTVTTVYAAGKGLSGVRVETQNASDRWEPLVVGADQTEVALPAKFRGVRIYLPAQACVVVDRYLGAEISSGKLLRDEKSGTVSMVITTEPVELPQTGERVFLERRLQVLPKDGAGR